MNLKEKFTQLFNQIEIDYPERVNIAVDTFSQYLQKLIDTFPSLLSSKSDLEEYIESHLIISGIIKPQQIDFSSFIESFNGYGICTNPEFEDYYKPCLTSGKYPDGFHMLSWRVE